MAEYKDRVKDQTNTTGTGTITVDGVAGSGGYRTIAAAHTNGATLRYTIINSTGSEWEVGEGVWTSSTSTLTRATVYASSNAGSLVTFSAGAKVVFTGPVAQDLSDFGTGATVTFDKVISTNNGNGTNFKVGDDVWLGDVNQANTLGIRGQQNSANGYIAFGSDTGTTLGRAGTGSLIWGGNFTIGSDPTSNTSALNLGGYNQVGGVGYHGFLALRNTYGSATTPNKWFRLNSAGGIEILNSAYSAVIFGLSDAGALTSVTLNADRIQSGTVATARLGSGTADSTTYLRGDGTWSTVSASDSTKLPLAGGTLTGNLTFSGTGLRVLGDFSNNTLASRTIFQTSTVNSSTLLTAIPSGTGTASQYQAYNSSDPANASFGSIGVTANQVRIVSSNTGTGSLNPITFLFGTTEAARLATSGNLLINTTTDDGTNKLQVNGGVAISGNVALHAGNYSTYAFPKAGGELTGNIGMNIGSPAWQSGYRSIDYSGGSLASSYSGHIRLYQNAFNNSGGTFTYRNTAAATLYDQDSGTHTWYTAPSGTGGTTISFTAQMTLSNAGALNVLGAITQNSNQVVHAGNVSTYALPIGGGTLTGQLTSRITDTGRVFESQNSSASNAAQFTVTHSSTTTTVRNERGVLALSGSGGVTIGGFTPVTSNNYLDYIPTTMNAYGTWPTANSQNMNTNQTNGWYDIVWGNYTGSINTPSAPSSYGNLLVFGGNTYKTQIFVPNNADSSPFVRSFYNNTWTSWVTTLTSANYTNYPVTGPTFRAARSGSYTVTGSVWSKIQFNSETWDSANNFDSTTNYRFTPTKAGYYSVTVNASGPSQCIASIYKNGSEYATSGWGSGGAYHGVTDLVYFNGSTDYVEGYVWTDGTTIYGGSGTNFSAFWIQP